MLPPLVRRCPDCGHLGLWFRFERAPGDRDGAGSGPVECPACGHRFEPVEKPWLN